MRFKSSINHLIRFNLYLKLSHCKNLLNLKSITIIATFRDMDFFFDDELRKFIKQASLGILVIGALIGIKSGLQKLMIEEEQSQNDEQINKDSGDKRKKKPAGIFNQGNTCFVNSLLQALGSLKEFINNLDCLLKKCQYKLSYDQVLVLQLKNALEKINRDSESVDISSLLEVLGGKTDLINFQQQDAYELYSVIVASFQKVINQQKIQTLSRSFSIEQIHDEQQEGPRVSVRKSLQNEYEQCEIYEEKDCNSLLGYTKSSITCTGCKLEKNIKIHPFYDISFDISHPGITTITQAMDKFQEKEVITGWICAKCSIEEHKKKLKLNATLLEKQYINNINYKGSAIEKEQAQFLISVVGDIVKFCDENLKDDELQITDMNEQLSAYILKYEKEYTQLENNKWRDRIFVEIEQTKRTIFKQTVISKFPKVLVIHLKQLSMNPFTGQPILLRKFVDFDQKLKIPIRNGVKTYNLSSLLSHVGNESMGHYYTFRKMESTQKQWYMLSDTVNKQCHWYALKKCLPYMLFYEIEDHALINMKAPVSPQ